MGGRKTNLDLVLGAFVKEGSDEREDKADGGAAVDDDRLAQHLWVIVLVHLQTLVRGSRISLQKSTLKVIPLIMTALHSNHN